MTLTLVPGTFSWTDIIPLFYDVECLISFAYMLSEPTGRPTITPLVPFFAEEMLDLVFLNKLLMFE